MEETAEVLKISPQSVMRDWKPAKAWLLRELSRHDLPEQVMEKAFQPLINADER